MRTILQPPDLACDRRLVGAELARVEALSRLPGWMQVDVEEVRLYSALLADSVEMGDLLGERVYRPVRDAALIRLDDGARRDPATAELISLALQVRCPHVCVSEWDVTVAT